MFFAVDIDGVVAKDTNAYARYLNRVFDLRVSEQVLTQVQNRTAFSRLPEVQTYIAQGEEYQQRYLSVVKQAQYEGEVQQHFIPVQGAREAVMALARRGSFCYVTCRKSATLDITCDWLARHGFPSHEQVFCCDQSFFEKYVYAHQLAGKDEPIVMIDDRALDLVKSFAGLIKYHRLVAKSIVKRLAVLAYGKEALPPYPFKQEVFPMLALPTWEALEELIGARGEIVAPVQSS